MSMGTSEENGPSLAALVATFARGIDRSEILPEARKLAIAGDMGQAAIDSITEVAVDRVSRWNDLYLKYFKDGWCHSGLLTVERAGEYFTGDLVEASKALVFFPTWVEAALPKEHLNQIMAACTEAMLEGGQTQAQIKAEILGRLTEPRKSIFESAWNTPERQELRSQISARLIGKSGAVCPNCGKPISEFLAPRRCGNCGTEVSPTVLVQTGAAVVKESLGCIGLLFWAGVLMVIALVISAVTGHKLK